MLKILFLISFEIYLTCILLLKIVFMSKKNNNKRGAPKGHVGNPNGNNQWDGIRSSKPIGVRLLKNLDEELRDYAKKQGLTLTQFIEQAVAEKLAKVKTSS